MGAETEKKLEAMEQEKAWRSVATYKRLVPQRMAWQANL